MASARFFIRRVLEGRPRYVVDTAALLTSELVTNSVVHGRTPVDVSVTDEEEIVRVAVTDQSPGLPVLRRGDPSLSGRGLFIVDQLADRWSVTENHPGKTVWFAIDLAKGSTRSSQ